MKIAAVTINLIVAAAIVLLNLSVLIVETSEDENAEKIY